MEQIPIAGGGSGVTVYRGGDPPTLVVNFDINNTIYLSHSNAVSANDSRSIPLSPQSFLTLSGKDDVYAACASGQSATLYQIPGALNFFQSGITGNNFRINNKGIFYYSGTPALGNLIASIASVGGTDPFGNVYPSGLMLGGETNPYFTVDTNGVAYFFNAIAANIIRINPTREAMYFYNHAGGALGNLIVSIASKVGNDPFGNAVPQGLQVLQGVISGSTFNGTNFIINPAGEFFYSGTPAAGNLVASVSPNGGTDSFGNAYLAGIASYFGGGPPLLAASLGDNGALQLAWANTSAGPWHSTRNMPTDRSW